MELETIRQHIDDIDHQIIALLGERAKWVSQVAQLKKSRGVVTDPEREQAVYETRRQWAVESGIDPDFVEYIYHLVVAHFTQIQRGMLEEAPEEENTLPKQGITQ